MATTIQISDELWEKLNARKLGRGDSFEDVINRAINEIPEIITQASPSQTQKQKEVNLL